MNRIDKISSNLPLFLGLLLIVLLSACTGAKTTSEAPSPTNSNQQVSTTENTKSAQEDAQSVTRRNQLNADIRAREQRNNIAGNNQQRAEADLASEVRSKLEANIPRGNLTVTAKNAEITVSGAVKTQEELNKIKPLAMEIKGVRSVVVKTVINP